MRDLSRPAEAYFFVAMLSGLEDLFHLALDELLPFFGKVFHRTDPAPWRHSTYYEEELGSDLMRSFVFFSEAGDPVRLVEAKKATMEVEKKLGRKNAGGTLRNINIDPGYMTQAKLVLASSKDFSHRIYIGDGVHAEVTLYFRDNKFRPFFYTYHDYRSEENIRLFNAVRKKYFSDPGH